MHMGSLRDMDTEMEHGEARDHMDNDKGSAVGEAVRQYPGRKARTRRFTLGAPRSATVVGDGSRAFFLRSDGPEDPVTSLWLSVITQQSVQPAASSGVVAGQRADPSQKHVEGVAHEVLLADPRALLPDAD